MGAERCDQNGLGVLLLWLKQARGLSAAARTVAAWEIALLGSCHLVKTLGKLPLGKRPL